jgi:hypothetical protein
MLLPFQGDSFFCRLYPGRCPGLCAHWLLLRPSRLGHSSKLDGSRCSVRCPFGARH